MTHLETAATTHVLSVDGQALLTWRAELRAVITASPQPVVQASFGRAFIWPEGAALEVEAGDAVFALWCDRSVAGGFPATRALCTDPACAAALRHRRGDLEWDDEHVPGQHFALIPATAVPGVRWAGEPGDRA